MSKAPLPVKTEFLTIATPEKPLALKQGGLLKHAQLAYETWGKLNADRSNAILLFHALSGSHHAAGRCEAIDGIGDIWQPELHLGWWEDYIGPGKTIDTDQFFVVCFNYLGGCYGSTGPSSIDPETGKAYGSAFPNLSVVDQAKAGSLLLDHFAIQKLHAVVGPSVGGLCALSFAMHYPERVKNILSIAAGMQTTVLNRLILFEQILAIENDPHFNGGDYYGGEHPTYGLALARMISHKTFVHLDTFEKRAKADVIKQSDRLAWYTVRDQFQSYMLHQGTKFTKRFDANTYLRIIDMWSCYNACEELGVKNAKELFAISKEHGHRYLIFSINSDFCFYPEEQERLVDGLKKAKVEHVYITVHSDKGHDSFLLEPLLYRPHIKELLSAE